MGLSHVVITSVNRDELPDGGATLFARQGILPQGWRVVKARMGRVPPPKSPQRAGEGGSPAVRAGGKITPEPREERATPE
jgi:hypothetical protein